MSQENPFSQSFQSQPHPVFNPGSGLYQTELPLQFAASVPHRSQPPVSLDFQQASYRSPDSIMSCAQNYPNSPFERPESLMSAGNTVRPLQTKAERRAEHNATERARRENLNAKFQQLAHILPNLQNDNRHSKVTIIDRTLDYIKESVIREEQMKNRVKELEKINSVLLSQLDDRSYKRKKSIQMDPPLLSVPPASPGSAKSVGSDHVKEDVQKPSPITMVKQSSPLDQAVGYLPTTQVARAPHYSSVSPPATNRTPRAAPLHNWSSKNEIQLTNNIKQEQTPYYDFEQLYAIMPGTHLNYQSERGINSSRYVEQQRYIPMTVIEQHQPNPGFYRPQRP
ncbi:hypothetical protein BY458DRAFT_436683 [Sporodiniella umbellata]|nr:hypothetical protein BY458DRAFT_436683 [Sporodiniella umbellata]